MRPFILRIACLGVAGAAASAAAQHATTVDERAAAWRDHQAMAEASYFRGLAWRADGPVKTGARVEAIAIPPGNTGTIYVGVASGNVWKTVNNGLTWRPIFDHESAFSIGDVAVAPSNANVVWVGTGEAQPRFAGYDFPGTGVFKSVDAGAHWASMGLADTHHIGTVLIDPRNADVVYVAAMGHQWSANHERGVFRTRDGGRHWRQVLYIDDSTGVIDLAMSPTDSRTLYAWGWQIEQGERGGFFKSTDGGDHWRRISAGLPDGPLGRANIGVSPSDARVLYLFLDNRAPSPIKGRPYVGGEVYRSNDGGEHWHRANTQDLFDVFGVFGWKFCDVHVDPRDPQHVYILGNRAFESFDGGATWRRLGDRILRVHHTDGRAMHLDQHELVIDPANPDRLLLGNDGGLFMSYDAGASWLHLNDIPVSQMYFVTTDDARPYRIYAGTQDDAAVYGPSNASLDDDEPAVWRSVYLDRWTGGDSFVTRPDPTDSRIVYYEHQNGDMRRMDVTGTSVLTDGPSAVDIHPHAPAGAPRVRFSWYTPFLISHYDPRTLYAGGTQVLKSTDRGEHWTVVSPDVGDPVGTDRGLVTTGALTRLDESPLERGMLAGGTEGGRVWLTQDDGGHWRRIDAGLPRDWTTCVTLSRWDAGTMYVSFTGYRRDDERPEVFVSTDTGRTWRSIAANLPMESVFAIKEDPADPQLLYLGTDRGVYVSRDRGARWESLSATLPTTPVMDLTVQARARELVIGTYGRGAWILDLTPIRDRTAVSPARPVYVYPTRDATVDWFGWEAVPGERRGRNVARMQMASVAAGVASFVVRDSTGAVVRHWSAPVSPGVNSFAWDLQAARPDGELRDAAPGTYTVDVVVGAGSATQRITVLADPNRPR